MRWLVILVLLALLAACSSEAPGQGFPTSSAPPPTTRPLPTATPAPTPTPTPAPLADRLNDLDPRVRLAAIRELDGHSDPTAIAALTRAASDRDQDVALAAIGALGSAGGDEATQALLALVAAFPDEVDAYALQRFAAALTSLGVIGGATAIARLLEIAVTEGSPTDVAWSVNQVLATLATEDVSALVKALKHPNMAVRVEAIERLAAIGGPEVIDPLIGQVGSKNASVRSAAIGALGVVGGSKATSALVKAVAKNSTFAEATAALVLLYEGDAAPLLKYLKAAKTVKVYAAIIRIGQSGTEKALTTALAKFGSKNMALDYLNCGNAKLDKAARTWASRHGYIVYTLPGGGGGSVVWGQ